MIQSELYRNIQNYRIKSLQGNIIGDFDSDSGYVTNQKDIVDCAKTCYLKYPTIVNNIPKDKNKYTNDIENYSKIDNKLSHAQSAIGGASNIAQIAETYMYNFDDKKYADYVCILSVLA